jgi:hypothetical protein
LQVETCDYWTLVIDRSVAAGGRPRRVFMPHTHAEGTCALARHPEATEGLGRFLGDAERSAQAE